MRLQGAAAVIDRKARDAELHEKMALIVMSEINEYSIPSAITSSY